MKILAEQNKTHLLILSIMIICVVVLVLLRLYGAINLGGFFADEQRRATAIEEILSDDKKLGFKQISLRGIPIFVQTDKGLSSFVFLGLGSGFAGIFGTGKVALRLFMCVLTILAIILLGKSMQYFYKDSKKVLWGTMLIGLSLPWSFLQGMIFWDTTLAPVLCCLAIFCFARILYKEKFKMFYKILLPVSLILMVYCYFPTGFFAVLAYFLAICFLIGTKRMKIKEFFLIQLPVCFLVGAPFLFAYMENATMLMGRSGDLSIFNKENPKGLFISNMSGFLSPEFLFSAGDENRRHCIGMLGMLLPSAIIPLLMNLYFLLRGGSTYKEKWIILLAYVGILISFGAASLTCGGQPHSLRSNLAWPPFVILITMGFAMIAGAFANSSGVKKVCWMLILTISVGIMVFCVTLYLKAFFMEYIPKSGEFFRKQA
ncbi:MAG: hypothetical protein FWE47_02995 [Oscillospiraceae bacterium]|nr:hypothetical protein [Oscillospiraceae bacterium]